MGKFSAAIDQLRKEIGGWMTLADYDAAKADAIRAIFARFSRGNTLVQRGDYITEEDCVSIVRSGDRAMAELRRAASHH